MKLPIVLDTCTILNLLRIDEDDEFCIKTYQVEYKHMPESF